MIFIPLMEWKKSNSIKSKKRLKSEVKIKLVLIDQHMNSDLQQNLRKFLSPIADEFRLSPLGIFHSALMFVYFF
jgi:hypothetical protein